MWSFPYLNRPAREQWFATQHMVVSWCYVCICMCVCICVWCAFAKLRVSLCGTSHYFSRVKKCSLRAAHLLRATEGPGENPNEAVHPLLCSHSHFFNCAQATRCLCLLTPKTASKSDLMWTSSWWINLGLCLMCGEHAEMGLFNRFSKHCSNSFLLVLFTICTSGYPTLPHPTGHQDKSELSDDYVEAT